MPHQVLQHVFRAALLALVVLCSPLGVAQGAPEAADLWAEATLYRDEWGVPHVVAQTPRGLGFAFGYAQAEDHAESMLLAYRSAMGRLAEVKGESAAAADAFALRMGHGALAERALPEVDAVTRALCEGFAAGVNAWIEANIDKLPDWAEGVSPVEVLALWHACLTAQAPLDLPGGRPTPRALETANAWAVAPGHTPEGQTVLVINPHQFHDGPYVWTEAHLVLDDYNVYGATFCGLPVLLVGHNPVLGWGLSPNLADTADVFERPLPTPNGAANTLKLPSEAADQAILLEYYSKARPYFVKTETGVDERLEPVHLTDSGPIIEQNGLLYLWQIANYGQFGGIRQLLDMGRSQSLADFQSAVMMQQLPPCNIVYGDAMGNIFYLYNAVTGSRQQPDEAEARIKNLTEGQLAWKEPLPAGLQSWGWSYLLGPAEMPYVVNPESGFIEASGGAPWTASDLLPYTAEGWPAWLGTDTDSYRAARVRQLLRSGMRSFRDNQSMLYDLVAPAASEMKAVLLKAADAQGDWVAQAHPDLRGFLDILAAWDNLAEVKSPGMTAYHLWWTMLRARQPDYTSDAALQQALLAGEGNVAQEALAAAAEAARMMRNEFDRIDLPWGEAHRIKRGDRVEPLAGALSGEPIFAAGDFTFEHGEWVANYGYGFAMAVQFGETPSAVSVVPFGSSDLSSSPHYADQLDLLITRRFKRTRYQLGEVMRNTTVARGREITLYPQGVEAAFRFSCAAPMVAALKTLPEPPGFVPQGQAPFSLFVQPRAERPAGADLRLEVSFYIPPEFCDDDSLEQLSLQQFQSPGGWVPVPGQQWNLEQRAVSGTGTVDAIYAVLGPAQIFDAAAPQEEGEGGPAQDISQPDLSSLLPGATTDSPREKGNFKFEWGNPPKPIGDTEEGAAFAQPSGQRQFKFERRNQPEAPAAPLDGAVESTGMPATPPAASAEPPADGQAPADPPATDAPQPKGAREFKMKRGEDGPTSPATPGKKGKVVYGLPPHVLERQQKLLGQQPPAQETAP